MELLPGVLVGLFKFVFEVAAWLAPAVSCGFLLWLVASCFGVWFVSVMLWVSLVCIVWMWFVLLVGVLIVCLLVVFWFDLMVCYLVVQLVFLRVDSWLLFV